MLVENGSFALPELNKVYRNRWLLLSVAHRNEENHHADVFDLIGVYEKKHDAVQHKDKLTKNGMKCFLYWSKPCQCNIKLVGKDDDEEVWKPSEVAEFFRQVYNIDQHI